MSDLLDETQLNDPAAKPAPGKLREQVQSEVVKIITKGLENGTLSEEKARNIAKLILDRLPEGVSEEELWHILPTLDDDFLELSEVIGPIMEEYETKVREAVDKKLTALVRAQKFQDALALARKAITFSSTLS